MNFARINHLLIPQTAEERDRYRHSKAGTILRPITWLIESATPQGRMMLLLWMLSGALGLDVLHSSTWMLWCGITGLMLGSLAVSRGFRVDRVRIELSPPVRVTIGEQARFALTLRNEDKRPAGPLRIEGPFLTWDGRWEDDPPAIGVIEPGASLTVEARARFVARGSHHIDSFLIAAGAPFGLFHGPIRTTGSSRFLVVPRVANVASVKTPGARRHQPTGVAVASRTGESPELLGVRPYRRGDAVRDLHARTSARVGMPMVREYQEQHSTRIGVVVDTARDASERQFEAALSVAAGAMAWLIRGDRLVDLFIAGATVRSITLGRGYGQIDQALDLLAVVTPGAPFESLELGRKLQPHLSRLSCLVFVALGSDPARTAFADQVRSAGVGCQTIVVRPAKTRAAARGRALGGSDLVQLSVEEIERGAPLWL